MSIRFVQTSYTSSASSQSISSHPAMTATTMSMTSPTNILASIDTNMSSPLSKLPPGLGLDKFRATPSSEKRFTGRPRSGSLSVHGGSSGSPYTNSAAKNSYAAAQWNISGGSTSNWQPHSTSRGFNSRQGNKRYPQGMRLPTSSYNQTQNQRRRASFSAPQGLRSGNSSFGDGLAMHHVFNGYGGGPVYQRTSRFDPFEDSTDSISAPVASPSLLSSPLAPSPSITSRQSASSPSSTTGTNPTYTHYYYYDPATNSPTLAYADADNHKPHNNTGNNTSATSGNLNLTTSPANLLLETILNGRINSTRNTPSRSPSPPSPQASAYPSATQPQNVAQPSAATPMSIEPPATTQTRSPSPPHSPRPRSAAISQSSTGSSPVANPVQDPASSATTISPPPPPPARPIIRSKPVKSQRDAIANIVASMMLNRADGCGRRGRRSGGAYVKSGLSRVVFVE